MKDRFVFRYAAAATAWLIALVATPAQAQLTEPTCRYAPEGIGTYAQHGYTDEGEWHYWYCPELAGWRLEIIYKAKGFQIRHPKPDESQGKSPAELWSMYWKLNASVPPDDPRVRKIVAAAKAHAAVNPPPERKWAVAPSGTDAERPTFAYTRKKWVPCARENTLCTPPSFPAVVSFGERSGKDWSDNKTIKAPIACTAANFAAGDKASTAARAAGMSRACVYFVPGVRSASAAAGRVKVGESCDISERFVEGRTVYAKVAEGLVAQCSELGLGVGTASVTPPR